MLFWFYTRFRCACNASKNCQKLRITDSPFTDILSACLNSTIVPNIIVVSRMNDFYPTGSTDHLTGTQTNLAILTCVCSVLPIGDDLLSKIANVRKPTAVAKISSLIHP